MATDTHTPESVTVTPRPEDLKRLERNSKAHLRLESPVNDALNAARVLNILSEDLLSIPDEKAYFPPRIKEAFPVLKNYRVVCMTEEEAEALNYALMHILSVTRDLRAQYYRGDECAS